MTDTLYSKVKLFTFKDLWVKNQYKNKNLIIVKIVTTIETFIILYRQKMKSEIGKSNKRILSCFTW